MTTKLKGKLDFGNTTINYSVIKTKRRKTSEIIVDKDTVEIRAPFDKPDEEIRNIVKDKANWILKKQDEYRKMNSEITKLTFGENSTAQPLNV
jgi:predicted metal-dependent hydrolase